MVPVKYVEIDNELQLSIERLRNNGRLAYSLNLKTDFSKQLDGVSLIESLVLNNENPSNLFETEVLDLYDGKDVNGGN